MAMSNAELLAQESARVRAASERVTRIQVNLETAKQQYQVAAEEALKEHGTTDLAELRAKLAKLEAERTTARTEFHDAMTRFESLLDKIEAALKNPELMADLLNEMQKIAELTQPTETSQPVEAAATAAEATNKPEAYDDI